MSCGDNHSHEGSDFDYNIDIISPVIVADAEIGLADDMTVGQTLAVKINFSSQTNQKVHNVAVKIHKVGEETTLAYNFERHVHADGIYLHEANIALTSENNIDAHTDWILEAKVWGHDQGSEEVTQKIGFHVHPE